MRARPIFFLLIRLVHACSSQTLVTSTVYAPNNANNANNVAEMAVCRMYAHICLYFCALYGAR
jgi:hypothetical protein